MRGRRALLPGTLLLAALPLLPAAFPVAPVPETRQAATLRVGLWTLWRDTVITVVPGVGGKASLHTCEGCRSEGLAKPLTIRAAGNLLALGDSRQVAAVWLEGPVSLAAHGERLALGRPLRIGARRGVLTLAVTLPVETYVEQVVASESGPADTPESLRALAIVVRSFALHSPRRHAEYELCDSTHCQLLHWGGSPERRPAAHSATLATAGETLWFRGRRAAAWFSQNCGGRTAAPGEVWPGSGRPAMPWLGSRADSYCTAGGTREWSAELSLEELTGTLAAAGLASPGWTSLTVARRGESGRAVTLRADETEIPAEDFRLAVGRALGWSRILSNWFEVARAGDRFIFHGRGAGHGVGLCQAGAAAMAAGGQDTAQILGQYFPGAVASDEVTGRSWQRFKGPGFALETLDAGDARYLPDASRALAEAEKLSGLRAAGRVTVRAFATTPAFRDATLAPGWVAAFTEGNWIGTQPLRTLAERGMLGTVLRHEFLHALVEDQAGNRTPLWLREGLVETWNSEALNGKSRDRAKPAINLEQVDRVLAHAASQAESAAAHRAAGWFAARLLDRFGPDQVLAWLRSGIPASAAAAFP